MESPFQVLTDAFQQQYRVNFSVERPDGSIALTLSTEKGVAARRLIRSSQLQDPEQLQRFIQSIRFGIAIEQGRLAPQLLASMTRGGDGLPIAS
ncbi:DUF3509 domain-containing protein [Pseudomonas sp. MT3]|uniref:DUF3509 domain-containing protein n=1 Tax=Pseudomonas sp. ATCC 13867 TaxID=1294143 RepID=UPI0002C4E6E0|nr:DUF3509 domain-containing protein [Pseudomonas sp. ATCC 13867]AGI25790.1 hypothetical protein H681_19615 [Pseudomonas sp. ATCC 13867]RFQ28675.1 DUF3509 domain-containing protein [Pseudomonas sp. ATCC 13867]